MDTLTLLREYVRGEQDADSSGNGRRIPPERDLASHFGTSRSAIRQALAVLEMEKLVVRKVGRGTFVVPSRDGESAPAGFDHAEASPSELMVAREMFEPALVRVVVLNAAESDIRKLRGLVEDQRKAGPASEFEVGDIAFHRAIAAAAHNAMLTDLSDRILSGRNNSDWRKLKAIVARRNPERRRYAITEHERIVSALEDRDADAAAAAMRTHLASVRHTLIDTKYGVGQPRDVESDQVVPAGA